MSSHTPIKITCVLGRRRCGGGILCRCNKRVDLNSDPLHFFHCWGSQGKIIRRHDHIRDAIHDMIGASVRDDTPYHNSVTIEPPLYPRSLFFGSGPPLLTRRSTPTVWILRPRWMPQRIRTPSRTSPAFIIVPARRTKQSVNVGAT